MAEQPMKVLVVSDVHGRVTPLRWLLKNETADALFFLGDGLYDLDRAIAANGAAPDYPIYRVRGNCDIGSDDPAEGLAPFGGVLFFYTHGHLFGVKIRVRADRRIRSGPRGGCGAVWPHPL